MQWEQDLPRPSETSGQIIVLEAPRGQSRRRVLQQWVEEARAEGGAAWLLPCDVRQSGLWAGVASLVEALLPEMERHAPELLEEHGPALSAILPSLGSRVANVETLTDSSVGVEAVRNYAIDRAYRIPHGVVDFLDALFRRVPPVQQRFLVCEDYDRAGVLARRFFHELVRRRGEAFGLTLLLAVEPGGAEAAVAPYAPGVARRGVRMDLAPDVEAPRSPAEMTALARDLEERINRDFALMEVHVPELIRYWQESEHPERAHPWEAFALGRYNHRGFYEDALVFADAVLEHLDEVATGEGYFTRWNLVGSIFGCLVASGQVERAHQVIVEHALEKITAPADRARVCYVMAMLHARFFTERDPDKAERYLDEALSLVDHPDLTPEDRNFLRVFLNNGMALVRHRQGRPMEAVSLCETGYANLSRDMADDKHRLHRSVLLYNIAQVYSATKDYPKALQYFTATMEMDPNYSEYFNERGNVFLKLGRLEEAVADYQEAIRLSPPYPEVWTNLGQCYRKMGRLEEAAAAYERAIDLDPTVNLAWAARARVLEQLGRREEALASYDRALEIDPAQPLLLGNRAALRFGMGDVAASLADLDRAVELAPENPMLYQNRAVALAGLERPEDAARDLRSYLRIFPAAPDRARMEERIASLEGAMAPA